MERIKFYSVTDMSSGDNLIKIKEITDNFDNRKRDYDINDIIEFHNIIKYIDSKSYQNFLLNWSEDDIKKITNVIKTYKEIIACYMKNILSNDITNKYTEIEDDYYDYREDFFELIEKYKTYQNIIDKDFDSLLHMPRVFLEYILYNKNTTYHYGNLIKKRFFEESEYAEIILDYYEVEHRNDRKSLYFPKELDLKDKEDIIKNYIHSSSPNPNYLRIINTIQNRGELGISDKTRLESIKKLREENDKHFRNNAGFEYGAEVRFSKEQNNIVEFTKDNLIFKYSYDLNWIHNNTDFSTLLNNFIYMFEYVDKQMRISLINKKSELGLTEKFLGIKAKNEYNIGVSFSIKNMASLLQIVAYYKELNRINIRLEDVIEWFFKTYLLEEFKISNYKITLPSKDSTYVEKCKTILPEIDYVLKQYNLLVEDGEIDQELLEVSSTSMLFENVKSLIDNKNIYGNSSSKEFNRLCYYFFSDQCMLHFTNKFKSKYNSFYKLIMKENIMIDDYSDYSKRLLNNLISEGYIVLDSNNYIKIKDPIFLTLIMDLNYNEVISYWKYSKKYRDKIDELIDRKVVISKSTLLSKQEQDYFNYYLNQRSFNNTLDLRNKYLHGNKFNNDEENTHYQNYLLFMKILVLIIIKINDELCMKEEKNRNNGQ